MDSKTMLDFFDMMKKLHESREVLTSQTKDLTWAESVALRQIYFKSLESDCEVTVSDVLAYMKTTKSAVSQLLGSLADKGYIRREISGSDRRQIALAITEKGHAVLRNYKKNFSVMFDRLEAKMGEDDMLALLALIKKFSAAVDEIKSEETR